MDARSPPAALRPTRRSLSRTHHRIDKLVKSGVRSNRRFERTGEGPAASWRAPGRGNITGGGGTIAKRPSVKAATPGTFRQRTDASPLRKIRPFSVGLLSAVVGRAFAVGCSEGDRT